MGLSLGKQRQSPPRPELLGVILCRLLSHADRFSFTAVCRQWRLAGQQHHPLPWLCLHGLIFQILPGGEPRLFKIPNVQSRYIDCFDNWMFFVFSRNDDDDSGTRFLINPSSRKRIRLPELRFCSGCSFARKMVVWSPGLVAASSYNSNEVAFYRSGADVSWSVYPSTSTQLGRYADIAFHHGKLYVLTIKEELLVQGLGNGDDDDAAAAASHVEHVIEARVAPVTNHNQDRLVGSRLYLVSSPDKLLMVKVSCIGNYGDQGATKFKKKVVLKVFEADLVMCRWLELKALDRRQALFVGRGRSKALLLVGHDDKSNRVYFTGLDLALCLPEAGDIPNCGFMTWVVTPLAKFFSKV